MLGAENGGASMARGPLPPPPPQRAPEGAAPQSGSRCFTCNEVGHYARDCPKKRRTGGALLELSFSEEELDVKANTSLCKPSDPALPRCNASGKPWWATCKSTRAWLYLYLDQPAVAAHACSPLEWLGSVHAGWSAPVVRTLFTCL